MHDLGPGRSLAIPIMALLLLLLAALPVALHGAETLAVDAVGASGIECTKMATSCNTLLVKRGWIRVSDVLLVDGYALTLYGSPSTETSGDYSWLSRCEQQSPKSCIDFQRFDALNGYMVQLEPGSGAFIATAGPDMVCVRLAAWATRNAGTIVTCYHYSSLPCSPQFCTKTTSLICHS
jgi:hypothetical protein